MRIVGRRFPQVRWNEITSGAEVYAGDVRMDGCLVGAVLRSPFPHARIRSLDLTRARRMPGVHAVISAEDFQQDARYIHLGGSLADRAPVAHQFVRFEGEEVAAVAAETAQKAKAALDAIDVRYQRLSAPLSMDAAVKARRGIHERATGEINVSVRMPRRWGELSFARRSSTAWVSGRFSYPRVTHACMEPNTTLASWDEERQRLELWTSTQAPEFVVKEVSHVLGLSPEQVVCREVAVGGGFGAKSKICEHEVIAAALSRAARQPVLLALSREEEFATTKTRHRVEIDLRLSADESGRLCVVEADLDVENGAYNHSGPSVLSWCVGVLATLYQPLGVEVVGRLIDTAIQPGGQFRGYGQPQVVFALESLMDDLANARGIDPIDFRMLNANRPNTQTLSGARIGTARLVECLDRARGEIGWNEKRAARQPGRGLGVAIGIHGSGVYAYEGANHSEAAVDVFEDGNVVVRFGGADPGTGQRTILAQIAAEALGLSVGEVDVVLMDSETTPFDMGAWSSRGTQMGGQAVKRAATEMAELLLARAHEKLGGKVVLSGGVARNEQGEEISLGDLVRLSDATSDGRLSVTAEYVVPDVEMPRPESIRLNMSPSYSFTAHAVEVEVDENTGEVRIVDYVAVQDCGQIVNPTLAEGQIIGGVVMGLGATLGEEMIHEGGRIVNPTFMNYALPRAADVPDIRVVFLDGHEPAGPHGAKNLGELGTIPPAPAVANAIFDAVGVRIRELPITPDKVLEALRAQRGSSVQAVSIWRRPRRWLISFMRWAYPRGAYWVLERMGGRLTRRGTRQPVGEVGQLVRPTTLDEVAETDGQPLAGGTDLLVSRRQGLAKSSRLVSLDRVGALSNINEDPDGAIRIGAMVNLSQFADAVRDEIPLVAEAVDSIASTQIRNMATVGGNLLQGKRCWFFRNGFPCYKRNGWRSPCYAVLGDHRFYHAVIDAHRCQAVTPSDLATVLVALDASVAIRSSDGEIRTLSIDDLYTGPGETCLRSGDVLTEVVLPPGAPGRGGGFEKLRLWQGDFAVVSVAMTGLTADERDERDPRVVFGALASTPWRARKTERELATALPSTAEFRDCVGSELGRAAHPLSRNGWKLDAALGLAGRLYTRLRST